MNEEVFKIQKNDQINFSDIKSENGIEIGICNICNIESEIENHFCITMVEEDKSFKTNLNDFKSKNIISLNDGQLNYINKVFSTLNIKYQNNIFFKSIVNTANKNKKLTVNQYNQLIYLLKNGKSMYENNYLTNKN